jgi:hypothetical protein
MYVDIGILSKIRLKLNRSIQLNTERVLGVLGYEGQIVHLRDT